MRQRGLETLWGWAMERNGVDGDALELVVEEGDKGVDSVGKPEHGVVDHNHSNVLRVQIFQSLDYLIPDSFPGKYLEYPMHDQIVKSSHVVCIKYAAAQLILLCCCDGISGQIYSMVDPPVVSCHILVLG